MARRIAVARLAFVKEALVTFGRLDPWAGSDRLDALRGESGLDAFSET
jgi:hypothetical protein